MGGTRLVNMDIAKVVSLVFLYISHSTLLQAYPEVNGLLQLYLDCTFMFIAGYFCHKSLANRGFSLRRFWHDKFLKFIVPFWIIIAVWVLANRVPLRPLNMWVAYGAGLRFLTFPVEWDGFSLWFASSLIGFYLLASIFRTHRTTFTVTVVSIVSMASIHIATNTNGSPILYWNFFFYLIPFLIGYRWTRPFTVTYGIIALLVTPLLLVFDLNLAILGVINPVVWMVADTVWLLTVGLALTLGSLWLFQHCTHVPHVTVFSWVAQGSLIAYLLEPILGKYSSILLFPHLVGDALTNASLQFEITPTASLLRLVLVVPIALMVSSPIYTKLINLLQEMVQRAFIVWHAR